MNRTLIAAALLALTALITAPPAVADRLGDQCRAIGGDYTYLGDGRAVCCYQNLNPDVPGRTCDYYENGVYTGSTGNAPTTLPRPVPPGVTPTVVAPPRNAG